MVKVRLQKEGVVSVEDNKFCFNLNDGISVYLEVDEISAWLGSVLTVDELEDLINPKNICDNMTETLSEIEFDTIFGDLKYRNGVYKSYDDTIKTIITKEA